MKAEHETETVIHSPFSLWKDPKRREQVDLKACSEYLDINPPPVVIKIQIYSATIWNTFFVFSSNTTATHNQRSPETAHSNQR